ncbi:Transket_pyr domain-containing protein [Gammaproteobacteria bacterium]
MTQPTYKEALTSANHLLATDVATRFIGYGLKKGRALGTLKGVNDSQIIETPVAENLMVGMATGLALKGYKPVVFIERMDFVLNALDALVNHLDKVKRMSRGEFSPSAIIRCVVGNKDKPLYTGDTHVQDFSNALRHMLSFPVRQLHTPADIPSAYAQAKADLDQGRSTLLVEYKDLV